MKLRTAGSLVLASCSILLTACNAPESRAGTLDPLQEQFIGHWELLSYVTFDANGVERDQNYIARIVYDAAGNMSAVGMPRDLPERPRVEGQPIPRAGFAYFSTYTIEPEAGRVIHHVKGSPMNPNWVNTDLVRYYEFTEDRMSLSIRNDEGRVTGTLTWRRLQ